MSEPSLSSLCFRVFVNDPDLKGDEERGDPRLVELHGRAWGEIVDTWAFENSNI